MVPQTVDNKMVQLFIDMQRTQSLQTAKVYGHTIRKFIDAVGKPIPHITLSDVVEYNNSLEHYAPSTQHRIMSTVKSFFNFCSAQPGYLLANPAASFKLTKVEQGDSVDNVLTKDEVDHILGALRYKNYRNWIIVSALVTTGCRISEILQARWSDVYVDVKGNIGLRVVGKGKKVRSVKLSKPLFNHIVSYRTQEQLNVEIGSGDITPLFTNRAGTKLTTQYVEKVVSEAAKRAGITRNVHPHDFRHHNATMALYKGANIHVVQRSLGHSNINVTARYLHSVHQLENTTSDYVDVDMD